MSEVPKLGHEPLKYVKTADSLMARKIVAIAVGDKAIIYVSFDSLRARAKTIEKNWPGIGRDEFSVRFLDSAPRSVNSDTVHIEYGQGNWAIECSLAAILETGNARIFYDREGRFVDTIWHRIERDGHAKDRYFYLPDMRAFFYACENFPALVFGAELPFTRNEYQEIGKKHDAMLKR